MSISPISQRKHLEKGMIQIWIWPGVKAGAEFESLSPAASGFSTQVLGTFGGAGVVFEGSLDGKTFATISRGLGETLILGNSNTYNYAGPLPWVRPRLVGGDDTTELNILLSAVQS
jgi:hypothetical protein